MSITPDAASKDAISIDYFGVKKRVVDHFTFPQGLPLQLHVNNGGGAVEDITMDLVLCSQRIEAEHDKTNRSYYDLDSRSWGARVRDIICGYRHTSTPPSEVHRVTDAGRCTKLTTDDTEPGKQAKRLEVHLIGVDPGTVGGYRAMQALSKLQAPDIDGAAWESCCKPWTWAVWARKKLLTAEIWGETLGLRIGFRPVQWGVELYMGSDFV